MKEKNPIPQYLLDETKEMSDKYKNKVNFTLEELDQLIHDYQHVLKQLEQHLTEAAVLAKNCGLTWEETAELLKAVMDGN